MSDVIMFQGRPVTTSLDVATRFGKRHDNLLNLIRSKIEEADRALKIEGTIPTPAASDLASKIEPTIPDERKAFFAANVFPGEIDIPGPKGAVRKSPMYYLTRDGFSFFVMGFTGRESDLWKIHFIQAFNAMEQELAAGERRRKPFVYLAGLLNGLLLRERGERAALALRVLHLDCQRLTRKEQARQAGVSVSTARRILRRFAPVSGAAVFPEVLDQFLLRSKLKGSAPEDSGQSD